MGVCSSNRNDIYHEDHSPIQENRKQIIYENGQSSAGDEEEMNQNLEDLRPPQNNIDLHIKLINAYICMMQEKLKNTYKNSIFCKRIFTMIPQSIHDMILFYYSRFQVYGIGLHLIDSQHGFWPKSFIKMESISKLLSDPSNNISVGRDKYFIKSCNNEIYAIGSNIINNQENIELIRIDKLLRNNYLDKMDKNECIDIISNGLFVTNSYDHHENMYIKLANKSIYVINISETVISSTTFEKLPPILFENNIENIVEISSGAQHTLFLSETGRVYAMGLNQRGQCGIGDILGCNTPLVIDKFLEKKCIIISISCGKNHSCCIDGTENRNLWCFGDNTCNQVSCSGNKQFDYITKPKIYNKKYNKIKKAKCGANSTMCLDINGYCYIFGDMLFNKTLLSENILFKDFDIGYNHAILIGIDNNIYSCGRNDYYNKCGISNGVEWNSDVYRLRNDMFPGLQHNSQINRLYAARTNSMIVFN